MGTPHYVAKKVGNEYVLVRTDAAGACAKPEMLVGGTALAVAALVWRGHGRWLLGGTGGAMIAAWWACGGHRPGATGRDTDKLRTGPSFPRDGARPQAQQRPQDAVDEASMESFPASDPPAHMTPTAQS